MTINLNEPMDSQLEHAEKLAYEQLPERSIVLSVDWDDGRFVGYGRDHYDEHVAFTICPETGDLRVL